MTSCVQCIFCVAKHLFFVYKIMFAFKYAVTTFVLLKPVDYGHRDNKRLL